VRVTVSYAVSVRRIVGPVFLKKQLIVVIIGKILPEQTEEGRLYGWFQ
jgi:hypothetical protein